MVQLQTKICPHTEHAQIELQTLLYMKIRKNCKQQIQKTNSILYTYLNSAQNSTLFSQ